MVSLDVGLLLLCVTVRLLDPIALGRNVKCKPGNLSRPGIIVRLAVMNIFIETSIV